MGLAQLKKLIGACARFGRSAQTLASTSTLAAAVAVAALGAVAVVLGGGGLHGSRTRGTTSASAGESQAVRLGPGIPGLEHRSGPRAARSRVGTPRRALKSRRAFARLPLAFEPNRGQTDSRVAYLARGPDFTLFLTRGSAVLSTYQLRRTKRGARFKQWSLQTTLVGARRTAFAGEHRLPGYVNSLIGRDRGKWRHRIPTYAKVRQQQPYPGIDLAYYSRAGQLEYDFDVAAGADPGQIRLRFPQAGALRTAANGDLLVGVRGHTFRELRPLAYQRIGGKRVAVRSRYLVAADKTVRIALGHYDTARDLVIDPVLVWSTYLGGGAGEDGQRVAIGRDGSTYLVGTTTSADFPKKDAYDSSIGNTEAFVSKLAPDGQSLVYSTYLGGASYEDGFALALDANGAAYIGGATYSSDFPLVNPADSYIHGQNGFVARLAPDGQSLTYSTYLGGGTEIPSGTYSLVSDLALGSEGAAYVTGSTDAPDFVTTAGAFQPTSSGPYDAFVAKLTIRGALAYSSYLGGSDDDVYDANRPAGIAVDADGAAYVTGSTRSDDFPTTPGAFQTSYHPNSSSPSDGFVTKVAPGGASLAYSTYLGGNDTDLPLAIAVDAGGSAYVTGQTSYDFPTTPGAFQTAPGTGSSYDGFVTKLTPDGSGLVYSSFLSGETDDSQLWAITLDTAGRAYVTGWTWAWGWPDVDPLPGAPTEPPGRPAVVAVLSSDGSDLVFSTRIGGPASSAVDYGNGIAIGPDGGIYVTGETNDPDWPLLAPIDAQLTGMYDAFALKLSGLAGAKPVIVPPSVIEPPHILGGGNPSGSHVPVCGRGHPVTCATGNFYETITDLAIPGRGRPLAAARTYNAQLAGADDERSGYGWTHAYGAHATVAADASQVTIEHGNGATVTFTRNGDGDYVAPAWVESKLAASGSTLVLTYKDQRQDVFDATTGRLLAQRDSNGYETTLTYDAGGRLETVTDTTGRTLGYSYDANGRISRIEDSSGRTVAYGYDAAGNLTTRHRCPRQRDPLRLRWPAPADPDHRPTRRHDRQHLRRRRSRHAADRRRGADDELRLRRRHDDRHEPARNQDGLRVLGLHPGQDRARRGHGRRSHRDVPI